MIYDENSAQISKSAGNEPERKHYEKKQTILLVVFIIFCIFVLWMTVLKREPMMKRRIVLEPFWSYRSWIVGGKTGGKAVLQNIKNILFFIPFGALFPWKQKNWMAVLLCAIAVSLSIEIIQYVFKLGWCELDDVICNSLGAFLGFKAYLMIKKHSLRRVLLNWKKKRPRRRMSK